MWNKKFILALIFLIFFTGFVFAEEIKSVKILEVDGAINPVIAGYVARGIEECERTNSICVIEINTPGGLDISMRKIIKKILSSTIPVIGYVYPEGARSASAGVYILYSCHISAMSPSTNLGAAHPVMMNDGGKTDKVMQEKMTNDAAAYIKALAQKRGRNIEWAEKAVRQSVSIPANEAVKLKVVDILAKDVNELLEKIKNKEIKIGDKKITLNPDISSIKKIEMNFMEKFLHVITDPNMAYILMLIGIYGLIYEFASPGAVFPGIIGAICIILGLYALGTLPINYAGLFLIGLAVILFIIEVFAVTHGLLALGGIISFVLGSLMLIPAGYPYLQISRSLIFSTAFLSAAFFAIIVFVISKNIRRKTSVSGKNEIINAIGEVREILKPKGLIFVLGELWTAESITGEEIPVGEKVIVKELKGLTLLVKK